MNGQTFPQYPCKRGKSHHTHTVTIKKIFNIVNLFMTWLSRWVQYSSATPLFIHSLHFLGQFKKTDLNLTHFLGLKKTDLKLDIFSWSV